jgi:hypothetical protein
MQAVRTPAIRALTAALACALTLAACGGSDDKKGKSGTDPDAAIPSQPVLQSLTCTDWQRYDAVTRANVIAGLRGFFGSDVTGKDANGRGSVLTDDQARRLLNGHCSQRYARGFSLYKLYGQAAGFAGRAP